MNYPAFSVRAEEMGWHTKGYRKYSRKQTSRHVMNSSRMKDTEERAANHTHIMPGD